MTSTIAMIRCPYASTVGDAVELERHPDGMHRCTQTIPAGGDHLGQHTCVCGVPFVLGPLERTANVVHTAPPVDGVAYLLWSQRHAAWWKPGAAGYTGQLDEAGRFSEAEAVRHVVASAQSGIRDKVTFMVAAPDNWDDRALKTPDEWQRLIPDIVIRDPDGWRGPGGRPWDDPITRSEYLERRNRCTITAPAGRS